MAKNDLHNSLVNFGGVTIGSTDPADASEQQPVVGELTDRERSRNRRSNAPSSSYLRATRKLVKEYTPALILLGILVGFWEVFNKLFNQPDYILPPLHNIVATAYLQAGDKFVPAAWVTFQEVIVGYVLAVTLGILFATGITEFRTLRRALLPLIISTQAVPVLAIAPILIIWFGFGMTPKILIVILISFFPVVVTTVTGLESVPRDMLNLLDSFKATRWQILRRVRFPAALPYMFAGLKNAAVISVIGAFVGEYVGAVEGLGPVMVLANSGFQTDVVFAAIIYLSFMGIGMYIAIAAIERRVIRWHFVARAGAER